VVKRLGERGYGILVYDNLSQGHREMVTGGRFIEGDLSESVRLEGLLRENGVTAVMHFAAHSLVGESEVDPHKYYLNNVVNTIHLLGAMLKAGVRRIVFSSSAAVYGEPVGVPIEEDHPTEPTNVYGQTKLVVEHILGNYASVYGLEYASLRYFNAAGADAGGAIGEDHKPESHLIPLVLDVALGRKEAVTIFGTDYDTPDGTCIRDYIHVNDLAEAHILALESLVGKGRSSVFNLGNGRGFSVREVIRTAERVTGKRIVTMEGNRRQGDPARLVASSVRIMEQLGWRPALADLETIVATAWNFHRRRFS
jgi:UDP-glucose 4-epimerase